MRSFRTRVAGVLAGLAIGAAASMSAGQQGVGQTPSPLPLSHSIRERGSSVTPAYDGWYVDRDGTTNLLVGYYNRNTKQELDIPVGPDNRIEPGPPDQGQPTHFQTGHQWGVFTIPVPRDFGNRKLTWTLVANGQTNVVTLHTRPEWVVEPFEDAATRNTPPVLKFESAGRPFTGPPRGVAAQYTATPSDPLMLTVWATDEGVKVNVPTPPPDRAGRGQRALVPAEVPFNPPLAIAWSVFRGPGRVTFENARPRIDRSAGGMATTSATFTAPGNYILRVQANDDSGDGGGGFQCCWTNAHVAVVVKPAGETR